MAELMTQKEQIENVLGEDPAQLLKWFMFQKLYRHADADLVKAIVAELSAEQRKTLRTLLAKVGITLGNFAVALDVLNSEEFSPFLGLLDWDINRKGNRRSKTKCYLSKTWKWFLGIIHGSRNIYSFQD